MEGVRRGLSDGSRLGTASARCVTKGGGRHVKGDRGVKRQGDRGHVHGVVHQQGPVTLGRWTGLPGRRWQSDAEKVTNEEHLNVSLVGRLCFLCLVTSGFLERAMVTSVT